MSDADMTVALRHQDADALLWWIEATSIYRAQIGRDRLTNLSWEHVEEAARRVEAVADMSRRGFREDAQTNPYAWQDEAGDLYCHRCHTEHRLGGKRFDEDEVRSWGRTINCDHCGTRLAGGSDA